MKIPKTTLHIIFIYAACFSFIIESPLSFAAAAPESGECSKMLQVARRARQAVEFVFRAHPLRTRDDLSSVGKALDTLAYYSSLPFNWGHQTVHLAMGLAQVADIIKLRPMPPNLIPPQHPWITGINPETGRTIWHENVIYATENKTPGVDDLRMLAKVGRQLTAMVAKSAVTPEIPLGSQRRMPHGINYIHGSSHYNSGIIIFNTLKEGLQHFSDPHFRDELKRFVRAERREVLVYFRDRNYNLQEYALFVVFVRSVLHWFSNSDGPRKPVLWGNVSSYPVVNIITGHWSDDVYALLQPGGLQKVVRPPIASGPYFQAGPYRGARVEGFRLPERLLALLTYYRIIARGRQGNHSTFDRRLVDSPDSDGYMIAHILDEE